MSLAFIAIGDLHLDRFIWRRQRQVVGDAEYGFQQVTEAALAANVPLVLVGDVFDVIDPDPYLLRFFRGEMDRLQAANISVYVIQGNHDARPVPWTVAVHDHPQYIGDGRPAIIGGLTCVGFDYALMDTIQAKVMALATAEVKPDVLFLHQAVRQALGFDGSWNCDLEWVPTGIPLTVMGDIHAPWDAVIRPGQVAAYTGSTHPRKENEVGDKSVLGVSTDRTFSRIPIKTRSIRRFSASADMDLEAVSKWLLAVLDKQPDLKPLAFIDHVPDLMAKVRQFLEDWSAKAIVVPNTLDALEISLKEEGEAPALSDEVNPEKLLPRLVNPEKDPVLFHMVLALLNEGGSVADCINAHRDQFYKEA